jgi:hypothetical protein
MAPPLADDTVAIVPQAPSAFFASDDTSMNDARSGLPSAVFHRILAE